MRMKIWWKCVKFQLNFVLVTDISIVGLKEVSEKNLNFKLIDNKIACSGSKVVQLI